MVRGATHLAVLGAVVLTGLLLLLLLLLPRSAAAGDFRPGAAAGSERLAGPAEASGEGAFWLRSWGRADPPSSDASSSVSNAPAARLSGLKLTFPEGEAGDSGAGVGLGAPQAFGVMGEDVGVSVGAGVSPRSHAPAPNLASAFDQAGVGGRVSLRHFSLGGAYIGSRPNPGLRFGPPGDFVGGHDFDLSYSFASGSVSLSHTGGVDLLGLNDPGGQSVALSGHYLLGHNLDMTGLFALEGPDGDDPIREALSGFALRAGLRLSF